MAETVRGLNIKLTLDGKDLQNELNNIKANLKEQQKDLKAINASLRYDSSNIDLWKKKQEALNGILEDTKKKLENLKEQLEKAKTALELGEISEKEFNQLFLDNERMKYENMLFQKEVQADRYKKTILIVSCVLAVLAILSAALYVVYRRKDKMYTLLVEQHQQLVRQRRLEEEKSTLLQSEGEDSKVHNEKLLFSRIEDMMKNGKIFKANDLTVEKLSEMLDSNRTYVSNVINKYAGMSFPNYLNQYRINEAVAVISDTRQEVVLKALCNDLGYNSMTSFYRAFQKETGCTPMIYREKMIKLNSRQGPHMT